MFELTAQHCLPCSGKLPPLMVAAQRRLLAMLNDNWQIVAGHHLEGIFDFKDFRQAWAFTNRIAEVAETEGHHPDIHLSWGKVRVMIWTHTIDGLTESDFVLAAKIGELPRGA